MSDPVLDLTVPAQASAQTLLVALRGWMDAGEVAGGTAQWVIDESGAAEVGRIDPEPFTVRSFPGPPVLTAASRPNIRLESGRVDSIEELGNRFFLTSTPPLAVLAADEPHMHWLRFRQALFDAAGQLGVQRILVIGSIAGTIPHTRQSRLFAGASSDAMLEQLKPLGINPVDYHGPASFASHAMAHADEAGIEYGLVVVEVPAYIQGRNPKGMLAALRIVSALTGFTQGIESLRKACDHWEKRVSEAAQEHPELESQINHLEEEFDHDMFNTQMSDLKDWLQEKGLRVD
ncbi:MAG: PAC2 family protein [Phycisphaeraceae bacterium]|nr:PAC2 family protein [Phycisphaeraceae bacterium]